MERLLTAHDVAQRYGVTDASGRNYIRRIPGHLEKPLRVPESALLRWEAGRAVWSDETPAKKPEKKISRKRKDKFVWIPGVSKIPMRT